jgi:predicted outer membrane protein
MRTTSALLLIALLACNRGDADRAARSDSVPRPSAPAPSYSEPQVVQILRSIDQARLSGAQAVSQISQNESVLEYARVVSADHQAMSLVLDSLLRTAGQAPAEHALSQQFAFGAQQFALELAQRDTGVNNAYLAQEIRDHERALQLLQGVLIPSAKSPLLKSALEQILPAFHAHLQRAREILATRISAPPRGTPAAPAAERESNAPARSTPRPRSEPDSPARPDPVRPARPDTTGLKLLGRPISGYDAR